MVPKMATSDGDAPVLELLAKMTADSLEASTLDAQSLMLVRLAALVASDAPPASYLMNLGAAADVGVTIDQVRGVLLAVAPIVGTTHVVEAAGNIARALGFAIAVAEEEDEEEE
jgi:hypothetical protein